jgi:hypothetical protein
VITTPDGPSRVPQCPASVGQSVGRTSRVREPIGTTP